MAKLTTIGYEHYAYYRTQIKFLLAPIFRKRKFHFLLCLEIWDVTITSRRRCGSSPILVRVGLRDLAFSRLNTDDALSVTVTFLLGGHPRALLSPPARVTSPGEGPDPTMQGGMTVLFLVASPFEGVTFGHRDSLG
jgi:hypothetical protein